MKRFTPHLSGVSLSLFLAFGAVSFASTGVLAQGAGSGDTVYDELEAEKSVYNVYKAYFPNREVARKAAISFHANLLESDYKGGFLILQLDEREMR